MIIYLVSSWKNCRKVKYITEQLRERGYTVLSYIENSITTPPANLEFYLKTEKARENFEFAVNACITADLVIYVGPSGADSAAELGIAFAFGAEIIGLTGFNDQLGIMRKLVKTWFTDYEFMLEFIQSYYKEKSFGAVTG